MNMTPVDEFKKNVVKSFSTRAAAYEAHAQVQSLAALLLSEFIGEWRHNHSDRGVDGFPAGPVLEVGCGTGFLSAHLLSHCYQREIVVSDISEDMLTLCKARLSMCPGYDSEKVTFEVIDGEELEVDKQFSAIFSSFALQWFGHPDRGIARMAEKLNDGGSVFFAVPGAETFGQWKRLCEQSGVPFTGNPLPSRQNIEEWAAAAGLKCTLREYLVDHHYPDVHSMLKALKESGTATRRTETGLSVGQLRKLLRAGKPVETPPASEEGQSTSSDNAALIPISYHILYGCLSK